MRIAAQVLLAYAVVLVLGAVWRLTGLAAAPDPVALFAAYLGLTARTQLAPATGGAVVIGYLGDLLLGTPRGSLALTAGLLSVAAHLVHRRLLVRGRPIILVFSALTGAASGLVQILVRAYLGLPLAGPTGELWVLLGTALLTAAFGPPIFRMCRLLDARFARTDRERGAALAGFIP